jgi:hypothetical protein
MHSTYSMGKFELFDGPALAELIRGVPVGADAAPPQTATTSFAF